MQQAWPPVLADFSLSYWDSWHFFLCPGDNYYLLSYKPAVCRICETCPILFCHLSIYWISSAPLFLSTSYYAGYCSPILMILKVLKQKCYKLSRLLITTWSEHDALYMNPCIKLVLWVSMKNSADLSTKWN